MKWNDFKQKEPPDSEYYWAAIKIKSSGREIVDRALFEINKKLWFWNGICSNENYFEVIAWMEIPNFPHSIDDFFKTY